MATSLPMQTLDDSTALLDDLPALRARWEDDGCLFFRNVLDVGVIEGLRQEFLRQLTGLRMIEPGADIPVWTGVTPEDPAHCIEIPGPVWRALVAHQQFDSVVRRVLGESPVWVPIIAPRAQLPAGQRDPGDPFSGRHQDAYFNRGIDFRICWVPLMDIDLATGGLAIAPGYHKAGYLHDGTKPPGYPIPGDAIPADAWRRADYHQGDVVMFNRLTPHAGLANTTKNIRLSIDVRVVPESARQPVIGDVIALTDLTLLVRTESGDREVLIDDSTFVRGIAGFRLAAADFGTVLLPGTPVIAAVDEHNHAEVVRPSR